MPAGTIVASGSLVAPGGQQGIPGPNAVSTDSGNIATFGSDSKLYVPSVLVPNCITTALIANGQVTGAKIAANTITTSNIAASTITGSNIASATITNANLASGVAVANLGYTPVNKAGDTMTPNALLITSCNLGGDNTASVNASLRVDSSVSGGFAGIGINSTSSFGFAFGAYSSPAGIWVATTANVFKRWADTNGTLLYAAHEYTPLNKAGDTLTGNLNMAFNRLLISSNTGLGSTSYSISPLEITNAGGGSGARPGIGFEISGVTGAYLYYDTDNKFKFIDNGGAVHVITSS